MSQKTASGFKSLLLAALAFSVAAAHASPGYSVSRSQGASVRIGMDTMEVQEILGRPARVVTYRNAPGPSWTYDVIGSNGTAVFGVDFGPDGKVTSAREYWNPTGG